MTKVGILSLGCPRNLVDSEVILGSLKERGFEVGELEEGVDVAVINTCSFIRDAKEESIEAILEASRMKEEGRIRYIVVAGCLAQRYPKDLMAELPEVDSFVGTSDLPRLPEIVEGLLNGKKVSSVSTDLTYLYDERAPRFSLTPAHYAYIKISEGCDNACSYCVISALRGNFRSRELESVVKEAKGLLEGGSLREMNLIGQDTTQYGVDRYGRRALPELLNRLSSLYGGQGWVRLLYTHPAHYDDELVETMASNGRICKYVDLPVQHISDRMLKRMNRRATKGEILGLIEKLRRRIKGLAIRTSIIVGFPGETEGEFRELLDFVRESRFERLGAFLYSREEGTRACDLSDQIPEKEKRLRLDELMKLQRDISEKMNASFVGKELTVLVDERCEGPDGRFVGRGESDAPEVDGAVHIKAGGGVRVGEFARVRITGALEYDLVGEAAR